MDERRFDEIERLARRYGAALVLYARSWFDSPDDIVQDALLELLRQSSWPVRPIAWLYGAIRYRALHRRRERDRRRRREAVVAHREEPWFVPDPSASLDAARATELLVELDPDLRETVVARIWGGLSYAEIGELTGVEASTAQRRFVSAIALLRGRIDSSMSRGRTEERKVR
ncbi:MAG TPA: sigma-70 family RNA polymerase sigma factor [Planctomycetaceae bacterium]|nr:sigma-70 family RNA polymerase sigma factor [Planctomycetaceae bacterium]HRF00464.1 sigma-70 family RNA polymerase sigma factor [Pirellulaceae bacterium]